MNQGTASVVSRGIIGLAVVMIVVAFVVAATSFRHQRVGQVVVVGSPTVADASDVLADIRARASSGDPFTLSVVNPGILIGLVISLLWLGTGAVITGRQTRNTAGWLFLAIGIAWPLATLASVLTITGVKVDPGSIPLLGMWAVIQEYALFPLALVPLLFLLFPDGKPPTPRWRWAERALFVGVGISFLAFVFDPGPLNNLVDSGIVYMNPIGIRALGGVAGGITALAVLLAFGAALSTVFAVRGRYRRSQGEGRQQLRWLVFVATVAGILFVFQFAGSAIAALLVGGDDVGSLDAVFNVGLGALALVLAVGIPAAYLVAIMRYGLWDLDVVIRKAVQAAVIAVGLTAISVVVLVLIPVIVVGSGSSVAILPVVILSLVFAFLIGRIRRFAERVADRAIYGRRATPYEVLSEFSERVGETYSTDDVIPRMAQVLAAGIGASTASIWLRVGDTLRQEAAWPDDAPPARPITLDGDALPPWDDGVAVEVRHQGELLGALTAAVPPDDPMNPTKEQLVRDLAAQAGLVLRNARLIEDLRDSRRRLVAAQDDERRKLERNIHDGAQQQLVAIAVKIRLADQLVDRDAAAARTMLGDLQRDTNEALEDLRDLARGIYPPLLADKGLAAALEAQARKSAVPITVETDGVGRLGQDIEAAVYFSCLEALQNVAKYAEATHATVRLTNGEGSVGFTVTDDGRGFDSGATGYGTGLQGIADRLAALGGALHVTSTPGAGTTIEGSVPARAATAN
jgi:signal transduction histidine kinase